jgi:hypothetical protein
MEAGPTLSRICATIEDVEEFCDPLVEADLTMSRITATIEGVEESHPEESCNPKGETGRIVSIRVCPWVGGEEI